MTYKHWSFVFFITAILLNILALYFTIEKTTFISYANHIVIFSLLAFCFTIVGIVLGILSFTKKEANDYKKYLGLFGNVILIILSLIGNLFLSV